MIKLHEIDMKTITFKGKPVTDCSKAELLDAIRWFHWHEQIQREFAAEEKEMGKSFLQAFRRSQATPKP